MRASIAVIALTASFASAQYLNQTAPFNLVIASSNSTLNGSTLSACHEGAAIEGLCLSGVPAPNQLSVYNLNYSASWTPDPVLGISGYLTFELHGGNFNLSSPMDLSYNPASNVAVPLFTPSLSGIQVGFDKDDKMYIASSADDTVVPAQFVNKAYYRWYVCQTNAGYFYTTLAWVLGDHSPQNPSCQKVHVTRVFV